MVDAVIESGTLSGDLNSPEQRKSAVYAAFASGDPRFDGRMFVGVSSTGIYCRTVCTAKMPKRDNCTFFHTAAEAEAAGYRPCLTCRPEVAPGMSSVDARSSLARRAASMINERCGNGDGVEEIAAKLGYTGRHLRRTFVEEYGVTPSQYALTCRLLLAKSLLTDSDLPVALVAQAAGFGSVRRFNDAFKEHYRLTPTDLRKRRRQNAEPSGRITVKLGYRPPYRFDELLAFFRDRTLRGVELVDGDGYRRAVRIAASDGMFRQGWVHVANDSARNRLNVTMSDALAPCVPQIVARIRRMFDIDCDPAAVSAGLAALDETMPGALKDGVRLPGCFDPFETACRAVLGQQVSVAAANKLAARIVERYGAPVQTGVEGLTRAWPTPAEVLALEPLEDAFGQLGVIRTRSRVIAEIARMCEAGELDWGLGALVDDQMRRLLNVKGIGPWTASYLAMRAMGYPDAFLESDVGVAHALGELNPRQRREKAESWRPWRSYAVISLWNSLGSQDGASGEQDGISDDEDEEFHESMTRSSAKHVSPDAYACCSYESPLGAITLAAGDDGLKGLWFDGQRYFGGTLDAPMEPRDNEHLRAARAWLDEYFAKANPPIERLALAPIGTEFQLIVWQLLREIPLGEVRTYGDLATEAARRMGKAKGSARAVGGAVGHNPISVIVPCHRVVGSSGSLTGFSGGISRKLDLLEHEGVDCSGFYVPKRSTAP